MNNKKFRILYVINADWYFNLHWLERALHLLASGNDVHLAVPVVDENIKERLVAAGIKVHNYRMKRTSIGILQELKALLALNTIIKQVKPDIVHSVTIKPNLYASVLGFAHGFKFVSTYAGLGTLISSNTVKHNVARKVVFGCIKFFSRKTTNIALFENEDDKLFFEENNILNKNKLIRVYGAGVDCNKYNYTPPSGECTRLKVLFASRLLKNKGLDEVVAAVKALMSNGYKIELAVAGIIDTDSPFAYSKSQIEAFKNEPAVNWLGERSDIEALIKTADVIALPTSYGEGVPRILIEACSIGRPIITTSLGGCKDICLHNVNGFIVKPNNPDDVKQALLALIQDPSLIASMGAKGRLLVEERFSNEQIFLSHNSVYQQLINQ